MKKLILASAATLSIAAVSHATIDTVNKSGFYVGLNGGYSFGKSNVSIDEYKDRLKMRKFIGGGHLGYQHDLGRFVAGIELASGFTKIHKAKNYIKDGVSVKAKLTRTNDCTAALRVGYKVAPCWLAGISLGYAREKYDYKAVASIVRTGVVVIPTTTVKHTHNGFVPGIYVEKLLQKHFMVGLAYNYGIFKQKKKEVLGMDIKHKPQVHDIKLRLGYKF